MTDEDLSAALFAALSSEDDDTVRQLCSPTDQVRQNGGPAMSVDEVLGFNAAVHRVLSDFEYTDAIRSPTPNGFVEEHTGQRLRRPLPRATGGQRRRRAPRRS